MTKASDEAYEKIQKLWKDRLEGKPVTLAEFEAVAKEGGASKEALDFVIDTAELVEAFFGAEMMASIEDAVDVINSLGNTPELSEKDRSVHYCNALVALFQSGVYSYRTALRGVLPTETFEVTELKMKLMQVLPIMK